MKMLASALGLYVLLLAVLPTFANLKLMEKKEHCKKLSCRTERAMDTKSIPVKNKGCSKNHCTVFSGCKEIQVIFPVLAKIPARPFVVNKVVGYFSEIYSSTEKSSVWHPPKIA